MVGQPPWVREPPGWFAPAVKRVLDAADALLAAQGPRELEQATAVLLGGEFEHALRAEREGLWLRWWTQVLIDVGTGRVIEALDAGDPGWQPAMRLLHGLTSIVPADLLPAARSGLGRARKAARKQAGSSFATQPGWLATMHKPEPTGRVWRLVDSYGDRFGILTEVRYPGEPSSVFLSDIDAASFTHLSGGGDFDNADDAVDAWRSSVGESAAGAAPVVVTDPGDLRCLAAAFSRSAAPETFFGDEQRPVLDNWLRARRRFDDLHRVFTSRGMHVPETMRRDRVIDTTEWVRDFAAWHADRHGHSPNTDAVDAVAHEWLEIVLPGTESAASPRRAHTFRELMGDWVDDDVTHAARRLLPEWVRWCAEDTGVPAHLVEQAVSAAR